MADEEEKSSIIYNDISISHCTRRIPKIISGWQAGTDQTALDVAIEEGIAYRSWISKGRKKPGWPGSRKIPSERNGDSGSPGRNEPRTQHGPFPIAFSGVLRCFPAIP